MNTAKTKVLHFRYESDPEPILNLDGTAIDVCNIYNHLVLLTLSSRVVMYQRFTTIWSAVTYLRLIFHLTSADALKIKLFNSVVKAIAAYALESLPLHLATSIMFDACQRQMIDTALCINWQNNFKNEEVYAKSVFLAVQQEYQKRTLQLIGHSLHLQSRFIIPLGSMLHDLNAVFSVRRGQGQTWTLAI